MPPDGQNVRRTIYTKLIANCKVSAVHRSAYFDYYFGQKKRGRFLCSENSGNLSAGDTE